MPLDTPPDVMFGFDLDTWHPLEVVTAEEYAATGEPVDVVLDAHAVEYKKWRALIWFQGEPAAELVHCRLLMAGRLVTNPGAAVQVTAAQRGECETWLRLKESPETVIRPSDGTLRWT